MQQQQLTQYFQRIGLPINTQTSLDNLRQIHQAQHRSLPFENFSVINGQAINLDDDAIFEKLIHQQRGGYCHELNGLLLSLLSSLGFEVRALLGRVHLLEQPTGRGHRVSLVTIDNKPWLVDAGFGAFTPRAPLPIRLNEPLYTDLQCFRFIEDDRFGVMLQIHHLDAWKDLYSLDMTYVCDNDLVVANHFSSTHPSSHFTLMCIAAIATAEGVTTLANQHLKITTHSGVIEQELTDKAAYFTALKTHFGLVPDMPFSLIQACFDDK
ncbi:arylamine N-acetyltransferase [Shewanella intestini]|uniref:Arylamine N-acetyltransferase n=1 Tax=Shewanella intestini TaxID=2017544 RepID=A0ABS5I538_9GAMM|nr:MULTISPECIES: arylamine N-acetyltransferase [Shewanella]MBR9728819.1 arylamine N-acetyltransferase [Shewanella intestini]MRG36895.1 arylamine N-acetyltransferase [Shewanella sp. XMDDZSB0408]